MPYDTQVLDKFTGLDLTTSDQAMGLTRATALVNLEFLTLNALKARDGFQKISTTAMSVATKFMLYRPAVDRLLAVGAGEIAVYNPSTGGKSVPTGTPTWAATTVSPPATFGIATGERYTYVASTNAGAGALLRRYEDTPAVSAVTNPAVASKPQFTAVYPGQNRIAQAGYFAAADTPSGANGQASTIFFSNENAPETFGVTNFSLPDPGDGQRYVGLVGYQNQLFAFKSNKMYVFYGVSPDDDGLPLFDYKTYILADPIPVTSEPTAWTPVSVGPDGVYITGSVGLWKTTGGQPVRVPTTIDSFFSATSVNSTYNPAVVGQIQTGWVGDRLFINYTNELSGGVTLVWYKKLNAWSLWRIANNGSFECIPIQAPSGIFAGVTQVATIGHVYHQVEGRATDDADAVQWLYTTGYTDLGTPGEKRIRFIDLWGQDTITTQVQTRGNRAGSLSSASGGHTFASGPPSTRYRYNLPLVGRDFSLNLLGGALAANIGYIERIEIRYSKGTNV